MLFFWINVLFYRVRDRNNTKHKYYIVQRPILIWRAIVKKATAPDIYRDADYSLKNKILKKLIRANSAVSG
jgi:hypothetical protein